MNTQKISIFALFALFFGALSLHAISPAEAANQMKARVQQIDQLKAKGVVGENNQGYLEPRGSLTPAEQQLVTAENSDRGVVYQAVAQRAGQSAAAVGKQRALRIAQISKGGVWVQNPDGNWVKK